MDPNANLAEALKLANAVLMDDDNRPNDPSPEFAANAVRLAELVVGLDDWLSKGGFQPAVWTGALTR